MRRATPRPMRWFKRKPLPPRPTKPVDYPTGLAVETGGEVWYIKGQTKYKVYNDRVLHSWRFSVIARGSEVSLSNLTNGGLLGFRDGSLLKNISDGKIYLVSGNRRRHVRTPDAFALFGLDESTAIKVSEKEILLHSEGEPIE